MPVLGDCHEKEPASGHFVQPSPYSPAGRYVHPMLLLLLFLTSV